MLPVHSTAFDVHAILSMGGLGLMVCLVMTIGRSTSEAWWQGFMLWLIYMYTLTCIVIWCENSVILVQGPEENVTDLWSERQFEI